MLKVLVLLYVEVHRSYVEKTGDRRRVMGTHGRLVPPFPAKPLKTQVHRQQNDAPAQRDASDYYDEVALQIRVACPSS
jgi:hypothetical protein